MKVTDIRHQNHNQKILNLTKHKRQEETIKKWKNNNWKGIFIASTGFGKTYTAIIGIKKYNPESVTVVVPTLELQLQWQKEFIKFKIYNFRVIVINTASTMTIRTDLLIIDECHRLPTKVFKAALTKASYKALLMLTATLERSDKEHLFLLKYAEIIDKVTLKDCLKNNWISNYTIYNLGIDLTDNERNDYIVYDTYFKNYTDKLGGKSVAFTNVNIWLKRLNTYRKKEIEMKTILSDDEYKNWMKSNEKQVKVIKEKAKLASLYYNYMNKRKNIIHNAKNKLEVTVQIINKLANSKILVFSLSTDFADKLQDKISDIGVTIHSKMTKKERINALKEFKDNKSGKRVISSVKALTSGIDIPECDIGIAASSTSSKIDAVQSMGRILRVVKDKHAIFINLYVKNTQDTVWLRNKQWGIDKYSIKWIQDISEIKTYI